MKLIPTWIKCSGEAHRPEVGGMIDNCWSCAPYWENIATCVKGHRLTKRHVNPCEANEFRGSYKYYCKECKKHYAESVRPPSGMVPIDVEQLTKNN